MGQKSVHCAMHLLQLDLVSKNQLSTNQNLFNARAISLNDRWTCIIPLDMYHLAQCGLDPMHNHCELSYSKNQYSIFGQVGSSHLNNVHLSKNGYFQKFKQVFEFNSFTKNRSYVSPVT